MIIIVPDFGPGPGRTRLVRSQVDPESHAGLEGDVAEPVSRLYREMRILLFRCIRYVQEIIICRGCLDATEMALSQLGCRLACACRLGRDADRRLSHEQDAGGCVGCCRFDDDAERASDGVLTADQHV